MQQLHSAFLFQAIQLSLPDQTKTMIFVSRLHALVQSGVNRIDLICTFEYIDK